MLSGCPSVRPSVYCPLSTILRYAISLHLVEGFELNLGPDSHHVSGHC